MDHLDQSNGTDGALSQEWTLSLLRRVHLQKILIFVPLVLPHDVGLDGRWLMIRSKQLATDWCTAGRMAFDYERQRNSQTFGVNNKEKRIICILMFEEATFM